ncbi:zinc transporter foi [Onthophagus taurus]|uniref:zinc transporter foi n=1 Tax=Onthophagus taurus TaxID=166361 RepID=UPI000C20BBE7|nr:zinc transporter foi [Onthophagus taurus]XP_022911925.1 zinc transporter foi [Onthophagus taurus]
MVKHVISVCIFCFICATHTPCASHVSVSLNSSPSKLYIEDNNFSPYSTVSKEFGMMQERYNNDRMVRKRDVKIPENGNNDDDANKKNVNKNIEIDKYLKELFIKYGDGKTMSLKGFEKLMFELNVTQDLSSKLDKINEVKEEEGFKTNIPVHNQSSFNNQSINKSNNNHSCILKEEIADFLRVPFKSVPKIDDDTFKRACPALLYSILIEDCNHHHHRHHHDDLTDDEDFGERTSTTTIYIYSSLAVVVISLCGILGLFVIPIMQTTYYHKILQFLVALAVGTLAGDALLHLLPHAMSSSDHSHGEEHSHEHAHERENLYKGFVAMLGLVLFFCMERFITILANWRKQRQLKDKLPKRLKVMSNEGSAQLTNAADKQCKHKYSSFPYCYDEITVIDIPREDRGFRLAGGTDTVIDSHNNTQTTTLDDIESHTDSNNLKTPADFTKKKSQNHETNQNMTECPNDVSNGNCTEINKMLPETGKDDTDSMEYTVILTEHENKHHGHSHTHGHVHSAPKNLSSVVWMVIMGDGLHNFTDGMAIGAAFSNSLSGGLSTTVAVFCHELPHELGDFAMLLKAGMSVKQAVLYNLLSSILCILGNWVGLWLGNTEYASTWVFAAAAGMFLYIALVDMLPELSSDHNGEHTFFQCVLHLTGLLSGFGIMAVIALYEHDLKNMFNN